MSWAVKRQFIYFFIFILFVTGVSIFVFRDIIFRNPTCYDKKQNGQERGVDCGGQCSLICKADIKEPVVLWSRAFPITSNLYNLAARIENRNTNGAVRQAKYVFKAYDKDNNLLGERVGTTYIPPGQPYLVFEPQFEVGTAIIRSVSFSFDENLIWEVKKDTISSLPIEVRNMILSEENIGPVLSADIINDSVYDLEQFNVVGMVYDKDSNVINVSRTRKSKLESSKTTKVNFTWPSPFTIVPVTKQVEIQINPFLVSF